MPSFEVYIPATTADGFNVRARLEAPSWIAALRDGLARLGDAQEIKDILCDFHPDGIDITEPNSGRVFRIRELVSAEEAAKDEPKGQEAEASPLPAPLLPSIPISLAGSQTPATELKVEPAAVVASDIAATPAVVEEPTPALAPTAEPIGATNTELKETPPATEAAIHAPPSAAAVPAPVFHQSAEIAAAAPILPEPMGGPAFGVPAAHPSVPESPELPAPVAPAVHPGSQASSDPAPEVSVAQPAVSPEPVTPVSPAPRFSGDRGVAHEVLREPVGDLTLMQEARPIGRKVAETHYNIEEILSDLFDRSQEIFDLDLIHAAQYLLDLAKETIPSESGAMFLADINAHHLTFAAAFGPKAKEVMKFLVPLGQGIVGFCVQEGVSLAISDVDRDPRFYRQISQALGYTTHSILCAPAQEGGRVFGALELINREGSASFGPREIGIVNYLSHAFADYLVTTGQTGN